MYGLRDRQLKKYYREALQKRGVTAEALLERLESRLDNSVYRLGYGASRAHARQLVNHGLFTVNGRRVDIPSYQVRVGDVIAVKETKRGKPVFLGLQ
jgi:small subunit ribosomal protein S4